MAIFITWTEIEQKFDHQEVIPGGTGEYTNHFVNVVKKMKARYSSDESPAMVEKAWQWIKDERPDGKVEILNE